MAGAMHVTPKRLSFAEHNVELSTIARVAAARCGFEDNDVARSADRVRIAQVSQVSLKEFPHTLASTVSHFMNPRNTIEKRQSRQRTSHNTRWVLLVKSEAHSGINI